MSLADPKWPKIFSRAFIVNVATLGPLGQKLPAPGTWGSLAGVPYFWLLFRDQRWEVTFAWTIVASVIAAGICGEAARRLGKVDPGEVNLDEFIVMPLVFLGWRSNPALIWAPWVVLLAGFGLFRLFDILKPFGISRLQRWPGGWGIVVDDFAAALVACATLHGAAWAWRLFHQH
jgi:phosphatidylglycerophosphatase A